MFVDPATGDVNYRIRAVSWPQSTLARLGEPWVGVLQARFRRHSAAAMAQATARRPSMIDATISAGSLQR